MKNSDKPQKEMRVTWRVVRVDGPTAPEEMKPEPLGVIISTDEMLAKTQTLLFCPLIRGNKGGVALPMLPWHVEVEVQKTNNSGTPERWVMSTKIILPTSLNEIDTDGMDRGQLTKQSQRKASEKLKEWLPSFRDIAR
ncbi:MAG: hypothetical protein ACLQUZ_15480 [Rhizomicrobium sp.]